MYVICSWLTTAFEACQSHLLPTFQQRQSEYINPLHMLSRRGWECPQHWDLCFPTTLTLCKVSLHPVESTPEPTGSFWPTHKTYYRMDSRRFQAACLGDVSLYNSNMYIHLHEWNCISLPQSHNLQKLMLYQGIMKSTHGNAFPATVG